MRSPESAPTEYGVATQKSPMKSSLKRYGDILPREKVGKLDTYLGLIKRLIPSLNDAGIDYMFTGAIAASYYGTPRTTMDVDIIIHITEQNTSYLYQTFQNAGILAENKKIDNALKTGYNIATLKDTRTPYTLD